MVFGMNSESKIWANWSKRVIFCWHCHESFEVNISRLPEEDWCPHCFKPSKRLKELKGRKRSIQRGLFDELGRGELK